MHKKVLYSIFKKDRHAFVKRKFISLKQLFITSKKCSHISKVSSWYIRKEYFYAVKFFARCNIQKKFVTFQKIFLPLKNLSHVLRTCSWHLWKCSICLKKVHHVF